MLVDKSMVTLSVFSIVFVVAVEYNRTDEGYTLGLFSDCQDSMKPAKIKSESLKKLYLVLVGERGNWTMFHYYRVKEIASHQDFDITKKTFLYIGGYWDSTTWGLGRTLGNIYKQLGYNVLLLDMLYFTTTYFTDSVRLMREVGKHGAEMLATLTTLGLNPTTLEIAGLSLGGQTMSFVAKNYRRITGQNVSMLIGMDTGGPCFRHLGPDNRLDPTDADFVLAIITNSEGFGIGTPVGHASFYVNGGEWQPGEISWLPCDIMCSHMRAYFLWISALINPGNLIAVHCDTVAQAKDGDCFDKKPLVTNTMDLTIDKSKPGIYYLRTSNRYPFGLGENGLKKKGKSVSYFRNY
ncbi:phospholipase A1 member A-like [Cydia pomonella]|uniref:phospholipase A1 member A-like n=1 Tax=Cydia pomonella TaxID=82600 RepID=UPI002ADD5AC5|nr:phospholipase A1 member A-like [Cydia pomonella]